jgi:hypothetical protein
VVMFEEEKLESDFTADENIVTSPSAALGCHVRVYALLES